MGQGRVEGAVEERDAIAVRQHTEIGRLETRRDLLGWDIAGPLHAIRQAQFGNEHPHTLQIGDVRRVAGARLPPDHQELRVRWTRRPGSEEAQGVEEGTHTFALVDKAKVAEE